MTNTAADSLSPFLRPEDVASILGVSLDTVKRWRAEGKGPAAVYLTPRTVRYRRESVDAWAKTNEASNQPMMKEQST